MQQKIALAIGLKLRPFLAPKEDKFLTFPQQFFYYSYEDLESSNLSSPGKLTQDLILKAEFANILNIIPEDSAVCTLDPTKKLWNALKCLEAGKFAIEKPDKAKEKRLKEIQNFLTIEGSDFPSPEVVSYEKYKYSFEEADKAYEVQENMSTSSSNDQGKEMELQLNALRQKRAKAEEDWKKFGHKEKVEDLREERKGLEFRMDINLNDTYKRQIANMAEMERSAKVDVISGADFYETFFFPLDAFGARTPWNTLTLDCQEIQNLFSNAPDELKPIIEMDEGIIKYKSIFLEWKEIVVDRPWFKPEFFKSKYWKPNNDELVISDGKMPRKGEIPCYITSMIAIRNVKCTEDNVVDLGTPVQDRSITIEPEPEIQLYNRAMFVNTGLLGEVKLEKNNEKGVLIIAFICERVPKFPNPDKTLTWE